MSRRSAAPSSSSEYREIAEALPKCLMPGCGIAQRFDPDLFAKAARTSAGGRRYRIEGDLKRISGLFETVRVPVGEWWMLDAEEGDADLHDQVCPRGDPRA